MIVYKLFRIKKDGNITSLFINKGENLPFNTWLEAHNYPTKGFKIRPGWHTMKEKKAPHLSKKGRVWLKVQIKDFKKELRPKNQGGLWYLSKWIKILKIS